MKDYSPVIMPKEGIDGVYRKGDISLIRAWDTGLYYIPALSVVGRPVRGPIVTPEKLKIYEDLFYNK